MSIGIVLLALGTNCTCICHTMESVSSLDEALEPEKHLADNHGALQNEEMKKAGISDKDFIGNSPIFHAGIGVVWDLPFAKSQHTRIFEQVLPETIFGVSALWVGR